MKSNIKIFVSHRIDLNSVTIDNPLYVPVRCGAVFDKRENVEMLGDNTGDNISEKRMSYCELTVQYWAWKNVEADYYGLCHYRRYLSFSDNIYKESKDESNNGCVSANYITKKNIEKFSLVENLMREQIENYDMLICKPIKANISNYEAMKKSVDYHNIEDMDKAIQIIKRLYPNMSDTVDEYMKNKDIRLYNCYIMKKEIFFKYSQFIFSVLSALEKEIDMTKYGIQKFRTPGTIGERLFGIFCLYMSKQKNIKIKELQLVFFRNTEKITNLHPLHDNQVTIVSNFNNNYASIFSCMLISALKYISKSRYYEFIVLSDDINIENKKILNKIIDNYNNVKIRYLDPFIFLDDINLFINNNVYSKDLYVRTIIPWVLNNYKKVIVIDADTICKEDLANLLQVNIGNNSIAAVRDTVFAGYLNGFVKDALEYTKSTLKLTNPYNYCNTGVLIMNCFKIREKYNLKTILEHIDKHQYRIFEQDMINVLFNDDIYFLEPSWNMFTYTNNTIEQCVKLAPIADYFKYLEARKAPKVIHYAAHPKPWWCSESDFGLEFWKIARQSPYYEKLLAQVAWFQANGLINSNVGLNCITKESFPRRVSNILLPKGSYRRELVKKIIPKDSFIWNISKKIYYMILKNKL